MADRSVVVRLRADVAAFTSQMRVAQQSVADFAGKTGDWAQKNKQSLDDVALKAGIAGAALTGLAGLAVSRFANFDAAMSSISAVTGETASNMEALRDVALEAGRETQYSALEAAGGIEELAKAGVATTDIINGGLTGALNLAAAGEIEVAEAAETAATAMVQFKLSGEDVPRIADLLAAGANKAQGGVSDLAFALKQSGLVASQFGLDIDDTIGTLTAFAASGLLGSDAGTSFRTMLLRLANPANEAKEAMESLGIVTYDAQGDFVGMESLAEQLQVRLGGLDQAQRDAALATIFGSDAIRAANVLYEEGGQGIGEWVAAVGETGAAADVAAGRMDNLRGDLTFLAGSWETLLIAMGEGADGPLRKLVQGVSGVVNKLGEMPAAAQGALLAITGGGGLALLGVAGVAKLLTTVSDTRLALQNLGVDGRRASRIVGGIGKGLALAGIVAGASQALQVMFDKLSDVRGMVLEIDEVIEDVELFGGTENIDRAFDGWSGGLDQLARDIEVLVNDSNRTRWDNLFNPRYALGGLQDVRDAVADIDTTLDTLYDQDPQAAQELFGALARAAADAGVPVDELRNLLPKYNDSLEDAALAASQAGGEQQDLNDLLPETTMSIEDQAKALQELNDQYFDLANQFLSQREAQRRYRDALDDFTATMKDDEASQRDRARALDDVASSQLAILEGLYAQEDGVAKVNRRLPAMRDALFVVAEQFFDSKKKARDFVNTVLDAEGLQVEVPVKTPGLPEAQQRVDTLARQLADLPQFKEITVQTRYTAVGLANKFNSGMVPGFNADGGYISGPGGPRDDMIPSWLSNGEYVLRADAVARLGVPFLDALNSGRMHGFAQGGYVGRTGGETISRTEAIHIGQVVAHDYHDFRRQLDRERRLQALPGAGR